MCEGENTLIRYLGRGDRGKEHLEGLSVEGKTIFKYILKK
jgi:hypothetical protein